ncbi:MAG: hydroxyacid dehydrogenase [Ruminococcaceae bacterium]|nr:hydroxyacid dehydrogenase [Oscillospiraceae bacterium]
MKITILDKSTLGEDIDLSPIYALGEVETFETTAPDEIAERLTETDVVVINKIKLNENNLKDAKNLKVISVAATGYDNIDTEYCKKAGIALCNVPGYSTDSVAQVSAAMALSLVTHIKEYECFVNSGEYSKSGVANKLTPVYHEISSLKWGVVGGGGIGMKVAEIADAIGAEVMICRRKQEGRFPVVDIDTLCKQCDIISLHIPLSDETRNLINAQRIASMKKSAIVINTARGAVADEKALADAIKSGSIGGLGVDVYSAEPFPESHPYTEILGYDNVIFTPHMAWGSYEARNRCVRIMAENIKAYFDGEIKNRIV